MGHTCPPLPPPRHRLSSPSRRRLADTVPGRGAKPRPTPQPAPPAPSGRRRRARPVRPLPSPPAAHGRHPRRAGARPAPLRSMAKGPGQGDAFLHLPAAQAVPAEAQEERYAGLLGRGLPPCAREALPEPPLSAGIKAGKGAEPAECPAHPAAGRGHSRDSQQEPLLGLRRGRGCRGRPSARGGQGGRREGAACGGTLTVALGLSLFLSPAALRNTLRQRSPFLGRRGCGCSQQRADSRRPKLVFEEEHRADHEGQEEADAAHPAMVGLQRAPTAHPGGLPGRSRRVRHTQRDL